MNFCPNCGRPLKNDKENFCATCGYAFNRELVNKRKFEKLARCNDNQKIKAGEPKKAKAIIIPIAILFALILFINNSLTGMPFKFYQFLADNFQSYINNISHIDYSFKFFKNFNHNTYTTLTNFSNSFRSNTINIPIALLLSAILSTGITAIYKKNKNSHNFINSLGYFVIKLTLKLIFLIYIFILIDFLFNTEIITYILHYIAQFFIR